MILASKELGIDRYDDRARNIDKAPTAGVIGISIGARMPATSRAIPDETVPDKSLLLLLGYPPLDV
jgi:hypothetical protein